MHSNKSKLNGGEHPSSKKAKAVHSARPQLSLHPNVNPTSNVSDGGVAEELSGTSDLKLKMVDANGLPLAVADPNSPTRSLFGFTTVKNETLDSNSTTLKHNSETCVDVSEYNKKVASADLMMKMMMLSSHVAPYSETDKWRGKQLCDRFNGIICKMMETCMMRTDDGVFDARDVDAVRTMASACHAVLRRAVNNPAEELPTDHEGRPAYKFNLSIAMIDLLRTAVSFNTLSNNELQIGNSSLCYSRSCRTKENQSYSYTCLLLRDDLKLKPVAKECYATGDKFSEDLVNGLEALSSITTKSDDEILQVLRRAWKQVPNAVSSLMFSSILDGRRMKSANAIAARYYCPPADTDSQEYGNARLLAEIFDSSASLKTISRVVKTILAVMAMARLSIVNDHVVAGSSEGKTEEQCRQHAKESLEWETISGLILDLSGIVTRNLSLLYTKTPKSAVRTARIVHQCIADWFERVIRDSSAFSIILGAFTYKGMVVGNMSAKLLEIFQKTMKGDVSRHNVWQVSQFLVQSRLQLQKEKLSLVSGSNLIICAFVALSGAIGDLMASEAGGPFVFDQYVKREVNFLYSRCFSGSRIVDVQLKGRCNPKTSSGKTIKATGITRQIYDRRGVRGQNDKSVLMDTRLSACFFMLSLTEEINKDLRIETLGLGPCKPFTSPLVSEGRKDGKRIYVISLQSQPCVNYSTFRYKIASPLIEQSQQNPDDVTTTVDNVEKPFRDISGGAIINTMLYPIAGRAFCLTISDMVDQHQKSGLTNPRNASDFAWFQSKTNASINMFVSNLRDTADNIFDVHSDAFTSGMAGTEKAKLMMLQQLSFINKFCDLIMDNGMIWENLQLTFSIQKTSTQRHMFTDIQPSRNGNNHNEYDDDCSEQNFPDLASLKR